MRILAIESSCDETAAAVVAFGRKVLSNIVASQIEEHKLYGGVVPEIASRMHTEAIVGVTKEALIKADTSLDEIDAIAVTGSPGLIGSLLVGVSFAKGLSLAKKKPLITVDHIKGHIAANYIEHPKLTPPFVCLVASGGHSHIFHVLDYTELSVIARTRDDAAGECFDKAARALGMSYPGGAAIEKLARDGSSSAFKLPIPRVDGSPFDLSFSGLKTAVINLVHNEAQRGGSLPIADIAASFQKTVIDILEEKLTLCAKTIGTNKIAAAGGVCANRALRARLAELAKKNSWELYLPSTGLCGDNAAMIGSQAYYEYQKGNLSDLSFNPSSIKH